MSITYNPIAMYGKYFEEREDAEGFILEVFPEANVNDDYVDEIPGLEIVCLNCFSGDGYLVGFSMSLGELIDEYKVKWDAAFPDAADARAILEVQVC